MTILILGSILFLASHMISAFGLRARVEAIAGHHAYTGLDYREVAIDARAIG